MSGGRFGYSQYHIDEIANDIENELYRQGKEKPKSELYGDKKYYEEYPEEKFYVMYPNNIQEKMREAVRALRIAYVYVQRVDWYLSGDDGDDNFIERLEREIKALDYHD